MIYVRRAGHKIFYFLILLLPVAVIFPSKVLAIEFDIINRIRFSEQGNSLRIYFHIQGGIKRSVPNFHVDESGKSVILDVMNARLECEEGLKKIGRRGVKFLRASQLKENPPVSRFVILMEKPMLARVHVEDRNLFMDIFYDLPSDRKRRTGIQSPEVVIKKSEHELVLEPERPAAAPPELKLSGRRSVSVSEDAGPVENPGKMERERTVSGPDGEKRFEDTSRYSFSFDMTPLEDVRKELESRCGVTVSFEPSLENRAGSSLENLVTAHVEGSLRACLDAIFIDNGFNYSLSGSKIRVSKKASRENETVSLRLTNLTLNELAETLSKMMDMNIIVDSEARLSARKGDGAEPRVNFYYHSISLREALEIFTRTHSLALVRLNENSYVITTPERAGEYEKKVRRVLKLKNTSPKEFISILKSSKNLEKKVDVANIAIDERTNSLIIYDTLSNVLAIEDIIKKIDESARQVTIEARLVEVDRSELKKLGLKTATSLTVQDITRKINRVNDIGATIEFLERNNQARVLASPKLTVVNSRTARILIGETIPVPYYDYTFVNPSLGLAIGGTSNTTTGWNQNTTGIFNSLNSWFAGLTNSQLEELREKGIVTGALQPVRRFQNEKVGIELEITPTIHSSNEVSIDLKVEVSSLIGITEEGQVRKSTRSTNSIIRLKNNQTTVLGGIIKQDEKNTVVEVPFLGKIPGLGRLFQHRSREFEDTEMIMLITPVISPNETDIAELGSSREG